MPDLFDSICEWLLDQALGEVDISTIVQSTAERLQDGGIPVARISMGRAVLHPTIALVDMQWSVDTGRVETSTVSRKSITADWLDTVRRSPFADLAGGKVDYVSADLKNPADVERYEIFDKLAKEGLTGYVAYFRKFGRDQDIWTSLDLYLRGAVVSFATRRFSGFSQDDVDGLQRLVTALCICARVDSDRFLTNEVLAAYLGRTSSKQVLGGHVMRGDGKEIDCAILYSDLFGSVAMSQSLDTSAYLDAVNSYFDCTINAITEHGGEVLKLIGDGVLAIFPFDEKNKPKQNMCSAALASAREAFARAEYVNAGRKSGNLPEIKFGVSLHIGTVIYGNVGTEKRLDFTATGQAVGLAARVEALTRQLKEPLLATTDFADACTEQAIELPDQNIRGFDETIRLVKYDL